MRSTLVIPSLLLAACATAPSNAPKPAPSAPAAAASPAPVSPPATSGSSAAPAITQPKVTNASDLADHFGDSVETAVSVPKDAPNDGLDFMNNWTFDRFGRFRIKERGIGHAGEGAAERRYRITKVELPDGSLHTIYFDITENWNSWKPMTPAPTPPLVPPPHR